MSAHSAPNAGAPVSPEGGPVPCPPGDITPLFWAKRVHGSEIIFRTDWESYRAQFIADGWHPFALLPDKP